MRKRMIVLFVGVCLLLCQAPVSYAVTTAFTDTDQKAPVSEIKLQASNDRVYALSGNHYSASFTNDTGFGIDETIPVTITAPGVLGLCVRDAGSGAVIESRLYTDDSCTTEVASYTEWGSETYIDTPATYYLRIEKYQIKTALNVNIDAKLISTADFMGAFNNTYAVALPDANTPQYIGFTMDNDGVASVDYEGVFGGTVTVCDSEQSDLTDPIYVNGDPKYDSNALFALEKGSYYLKVNSNCKTAFVTLKNKTIIDQSGTSKAKAKQIKKGRKVLGTQFVTDGIDQTDYYKVVAKKNSPVTLKFESYRSAGNINVIISGDKMKGKVSLQLTRGEDNQTVVLNGKGGKGAKATYYIQVIKENDVDSGQYGITYVK